MDLESVFNSPLSTSSGGKPGKGESLSVWQAEVALRLSELNLAWLHVVIVIVCHFPSIVGFLRKVYGILTAQLLFTVLVCGVCMFVPAIKDVVQSRYVSS